MQVDHDVVFGTGGGRDLSCDIYRPDTPNGAGILLLHAGSWRRGDKTTMAGQAEMLTAEGYTCVASEYRLTPESPWPAQIHDVKAAMRWMRAEAKSLQVDDERIGVLGNSAGGHLGLMLAGTPSVADFAGTGGHDDVPDHITALVAFYPVTQFYVGQPCPEGRLRTCCSRSRRLRPRCVPHLPIPTRDPGFPPPLCCTVPPMTWCRGRRVCTCTKP